MSGSLSKVPVIVSEIKIPFSDNYEPITYQDNDGQDNGSANKNLLRHRYATRQLRSGSANKGSAIAWVYLRSLSEAASEPETSLRLPR